MVESQPARLADFTDVTEVAGDEASQEQIERLCHRYYWAGACCEGKDVVEVACGSGQGLGYLAKRARTFVGGDISESLLEVARRHYGNRIELKQMDAQNLPFADSSLDVVVLFEAIYFLPSADRFVSECSRVLRPGGSVLIAMPNKDLFDFHPSARAVEYHGVVELNDLLARRGFEAQFFGNTPVTQISWRQRVMRPAKKIAAQIGLIPKSMAGKKLLRRLVFGRLVSMPPEVDEGLVPFTQPTPLEIRPDRLHKVILCRARKKSS